MTAPLTWRTMMDDGTVGDVGAVAAGAFASYIAWANIIHSLGEAVLTLATLVLVLSRLWAFWKRWRPPPES